MVFYIVNIITIYGNISNGIFFRSEIQSLKKEITDQETSFKIQISAADKKASDYWVSFLILINLTILLVQIIIFFFKDIIQTS